jgi:hypothetical protein
MWLCKSAQGLRFIGSGRGWKASPILLAVFLAACSSPPTTFLPADPIASPEVTHRLFDDVLKQAVSEGRVDYARIQSDTRFEKYLGQLNRIDPKALPTRDEQLAFWINAYNAFAIKGILDGETPRPFVGWYRYFKLREYAVGGVLLNLYDLEHHVLRKQFKEPRVHFAIVCASTSCPKLQPRAYDGMHLNLQLDQAARQFINDPIRNRFNRREKSAALSMIFKWFESDFTGSSGSVLAFAAQYVNDPELAKELTQPGYRIEYLEYDWTLNGTLPEEVPVAGSS